MAATNQTWEQFILRAGLQEPFLAIVNQEGEWVDSCLVVTSALNLICMAVGEHEATNNLGQVSKIVKESRHSIVHSDLLKIMHAAGAVK